MKSAEIHFLTDEIINKIAAGEVIERPASAVKELIENSIDAGATRIQVQIEQGGKKKIQVSDNGKGMGKADLDLCYLRHTTSKLVAAEDLFHLQTNGFRGEAVASIAAVSKMTITSATEEGECNRIVLSGGNVVEEETCAAGRGTTFLIEDLFFNTPVRRTFLGSETSETSKILDVIIKIAIAHPEIRFDYKVGDKSVFVGVPGELRSRLAETIGSGIAKKLLPVDYTESGVHVTGFVSPSTETNGKRYHQYLFMRNRPIECKTIAKAISQTYEPYGVQCKPVTVLFLDMPDAEFDVNVHPAKREVRFANQSLVFLVVTHAIREALKQEFEKNSPFIDLSTASQDTEWKLPPPPMAMNVCSPKPRPIVTADKPRTPERDEIQDLFSQPEAGKIISLEPDQGNVPPPPKEQLPWEQPTLFQIANTYIAGEDAEGLLVIDQHAAHMRVLYEQALESLQNGISMDSQELLFPELTDFSKAEKAIFPNVDSQLKKLGFHIEPFGGDTYQIRAIPSHLPLSRATKAVHEFFEDCLADGETDMVKIQESIAKAWARTNAFQAGDRLKPEEMASLVGQLMTTETPLKSPYGNPTLMRITLDELAKKFRR
ncbi:DNA mismatch repair endonuclease MutL [uncultured Fibrobacter sp.]|uniref:DNA mismatch repair endonuclease MutL n=1 Tax=uncultured Fibrobacter sp. TaxID=261512 RepID=UPI0025F4B063|nr:DNA mismatch repair endonuclease MutL [uncultured Fibrobacter sp.]